MKITVKIIFVFLSVSICLTACKPIVNTMAFHPDNVNVIPSSELPDGVTELSIKTEDGVDIQCLYLPAAGSDSVVIYFHGNAGNIYHRLPGLMLLQKSGINIVGVSYRGYGKSGGSPSEAGIYMDGEAVIAYVNKQLGFPLGKVILFGRSIGSTVAVQAAQFKEFAGLILVTPLTSGDELAKASGMWPIASLAGDAFDNLSKIKNVRVPLLVVHGSSDSVIPFSMGKAIYDNAPMADKKIIRIDGAGHNDIHYKYRQLYWPPILEFIRSHR